MKKRSEKKTETLEVRLPHSKKKAFQDACAEEGITASHAVRTFIDSYLKRSRRVKLKRIAQEISMTLIRNPIKSTGSMGALIAGTIATATFIAAPSSAEDRNAQPIEVPRPVYPPVFAELGVGATCNSTFDVTPDGFVDLQSLTVDCTHDGFVEATTTAILTLKFEPKLKDGEPDWYRNVVYPLEFRMATAEELELFNNP